MVRVSRGNIILCDLNPVIGTEQSGISLQSFTPDKFDC